MKMFSKIFAATAILVSAVSSYAEAQNLRTAFFMEGYSYRYRFNPALAPQRGFVAPIPVGNVCCALESNLSVFDFIHTDADGNMSFFMAPDQIGNASLLEHGKDINKANINIHENLVAAGFWTGRLFHNIELNVRADLHASLPLDIFEIMKAPEYTKDYYFDDIRLNANSMIEFAYGMSFPIGDALRLGVRAKMLIGAGSIDINTENVSFKYDESTNQWNGSGIGRIRTNLPNGIYFPTKGEVAERDGEACTPERDDRIKFSEFEFSFNGLKGLIPGFGASFDFGFSADIEDWFTLSASISDLGFIKWKNTGNYITDQSWTFNDYSESSATMPLEEQYGTFEDDLDDCFPFVVDESGTAQRTEMIQARANAGLEFRMPFYERWSIAVLCETGFSEKKALNWCEGRFVTTLTPCNWLSLATSYAYSNFGHSWGAALSINCKGLNIFAGTDSLLPALRFSKCLNQVYRTNTNTNLSVGLNFTFGANRIRFARR